MDQFYLYLTHEDSVKGYPANTASDFIIELASIVRLPPGQWECALKELRVTGNKDRETFYVTSSLCNPDFNANLPILRKVFSKSQVFQKTYTDAYYKRVNVCNIHTFGIRLLSTVKKEPIVAKSTELTLHFKKCLTPGSTTF